VTSAWAIAEQGTGIHYVNASVVQLLDQMTQPKPALPKQSAPASASH